MGWATQHLQREKKKNKQCDITIIILLLVGRRRNWGGDLVSQVTQREIYPARCVYHYQYPNSQSKNVANYHRNFSCFSIFKFCSSSFVFFFFVLNVLISTQVSRSSLVFIANDIVKSTPKISTIKINKNTILAPKQEVRSVQSRHSSVVRTEGTIF